MSEIPDDVRKTADRLAVELFTGAVHEEDNKITMDMLVAVPMISRILLAEREAQRERGAKIAAEAILDLLDSDPSEFGKGYTRGYEHASRNISLSILSGEV